MEGISKETLVSLIYTDDYANDLINAEEALSLCKELPAQQWQTIDEFKANPVDGWCFLIHSRFNHRTIGNYSIGRFWIDGGICNEEHITHVVPIKTPEAPK